MGTEEMNAMGFKRRQNTWMRGDVIVQPIGDGERAWIARRTGGGSLVNARGSIRKFEHPESAAQAAIDEWFGGSR